MGQVETLALLPSALLGPAVWEPVREVLTGAGFEVVIAGRAGGPRESVADVRRWYLDSLPPDLDYVLVPHSNAGLYVPALAEKRSVLGHVFVDAILPPRSGCLPVAPDRLRAMLTPMADEGGRLPVWTSWWDEETVTGLFPSYAVRARVEAEQTRFPLAYFHEIVTVTGDWSRAPSAYLAFGDAYQDEVTQAAGYGWQTRVLPGEHLHLLAEPDVVAQNVSELWAGLVGRA